MTRRNQFLAVGDFQVHSRVLTFEKIIRSHPTVVDEAARDITVALKRLDWFDNAELVALAVRKLLAML
jgi:hypothetical protein